MFESASHHIFLSVASVLLLAVHLFGIDELITARPMMRRAERQRRTFGNQFQHDDGDLIPLADPDGKTTRRRYIRR